MMASGLCLLAPSVAGLRSDLWALPYCILLAYLQPQGAHFRWRLLTLPMGTLVFVLA